MIQSKMAQILDAGDPGIIYSCDLSAAFDLLRPDKFFNLFKDKLSEPLLWSVMDFLTKRKFQVELRTAKSSVKNLDRGCVQGSILGPRLFSLYLGELKRKLNETITSTQSHVEVISYADDTYVIVCDKSVEQVVRSTEKIAIDHINFLRDLGMVVNESKTEIMWIGKNQPVNSININGTDCKLVKSMKALGITFEGNLNWDVQAENALKKGKKLISCLSYLRKYMTEAQFLKAATAHYYNTVFYASSVWYQNVRASYKSKFNSLHFRILRIATRAYGESRQTLMDRCKRATPLEWVKFTTASRVIKTIRDEEPKPLFLLLNNNYFEESRKPGIGHFFDNSHTLYGRQSIQNRLLFMRSIDESWNNKLNPLTNDQIRVFVKKAFFEYYTD
jgi:hypothetical protein